MDLEVLKKKLSSFRGEGGRLTNVSDEILLENLMADSLVAGPCQGIEIAWDNGKLIRFQ